MFEDYSHLQFYCHKNENPLFCKGETRVVSCEIFWRMYLLERFSRLDKYKSKVTINACFHVVSMAVPIFSYPQRVASFMFGQKIVVESIKLHRWDTILFTLALNSG